MAQARLASERKAAKPKAHIGTKVGVGAGRAMPHPGGMTAPRPPREGKRGPPESPTQPSLKTETGASLATQSYAEIRAPIRARALAAREARESLQSLVTKCRAHTTAAVDVLVDVMQKSSHAPSRVAAAKTLIEFGHGKAPETVRLEKLYSPEEMRLLAEAIVLRRVREGDVIDGGQLGGVLREPSGG